MTSADHHHDRPSPGLPRRVLLVVLALALLGALGCLVWLLADRRGEADELQSQREQAMSQTEQFMLRMGTFGPDLLNEEGEMPEYRDRVTEVITPKFASSFEQQVGTAEQLVAQAGAAREAEVLSTGVSVIDDDSATVLVAGTFTDSYPGRRSDDRIEQEPVPFRLAVELVRTDGTWLVDDFDPVTGAPR